MSTKPSRSEETPIVCPRGATFKRKKIGVLDLQGSVAEHMHSLRSLGVEPVSVKNEKDLNGVAGLIIPGGESTTIGKLLKKNGLGEKIWTLAGGSSGRGRWPLKRNRMVIWGTCAGAILIAKKVSKGRPAILALMDIEIERNAYGGQLDSFETEITVSGLSEKVPAIFIRAPRVKRASPKVKILAEYEGSPVMLRQENLLATTFHPELTDDLRVHEYFLTIVNEYGEKWRQKRRR